MNDEEILCSALIASPGEFASIARRLRAAHFEDSSVGRLYEAIGMASVGATEKLTADAIVSKLDARSLAALGGVRWVERAVANAVNGWPVETAANAIIARAAERRALDSASKAVDALSKGQVKPALIYAADVAKQLEGDDPWSEPTPLDQRPVPEFPLRLLPPVVRMFVEELSTATQAPTDLAAFSALGTLSAAMRGRFRVRCGSAHIEGLNLYLVAALNSGERKSPVFGRAIRSLWQTQEEMNASVAKQIEEYQTRRESIAARLKSSRSALTKAKDDVREAAAEEVARIESEAATLGPVPRTHQLVVDDATPEALEIVLRDNRERAAVLAAEGGDLFAMMAGGYTKLVKLKVYLSGYSWETMVTTRVERAGFMLRHPCMTVCTTTQPQTLAVLSQKTELRDRGIPARFFYAIPRSAIGKRDVDPPGMSRVARDAWDSLVRRMVLWPDPVDERGMRAPMDLELSEGAREALIEFKRDVEPRLADPNDLGGMFGWEHKLVGNTMRLCGILHLAWAHEKHEPWRIQIDAEEVEAAREFAMRYAVPHARVAFDVMQDSPSHESARRLLAKLAEKRFARIDKRTVHKLIASRNAYARDVDPTIALLEAHGFIRPTRDLTEPLPPTLTRRRPQAERWLVNPVWLAMARNAS